eukprot:jgi/Astpho2/9482/Aster-x1580
MADADLTEAAAKVYDRQLRVWGVEVQKRLNAARVLIVGCSGLAAEVAKNIALAGVGWLTLMGNATCSQPEVASNFLLPADAPPNTNAAEVSAETLQEMNPLVKVTAKRGAAETASAEAVKGYQVVLVVGQSLPVQEAWDEVCATHNILFFSAATRGTCSYFFVNLHTFTFTPLEVPQSDHEAPKPAPQPETVQWCSLKEALETNWNQLWKPPQKANKLGCILQACKKVEEQTGSKLQPADLPKLQQQLSTLQAAHKTTAKFKILPALVQEFAEGTYEMPAVNAVLGGVLANEMLKAVSSKGTPVLNFFLYSLTDAQGVIQHHHGDKGRINLHDSKH